MKLALITDPLESLKPVKDSSIAIMRAASRRGHQIFNISRNNLCWQNAQVFAQSTALEIADANNWYSAGESEKKSLVSFDVVLMRQDPPFDFEYIVATWMLEFASDSGATILNNPRAIRDHSEKLAICEFSQFSAPTLVSRSVKVIQEFINQQRDVILKPLDGMGGSQIFRVAKSDPNRNVILETLVGDNTRTIMAQRYLPEISEGDKRILIIGGKIVPFSLARIPKAGETRGNLAAGGRGVAMPLTEREQQVAEYLAPILWNRGLLIIGLDMIGGYLTEINVTSPTCMVEIFNQTGFDAAALVIECLENLS